MKFKGSRGKIEMLELLLKLQKEDKRQFNIYIIHKIPWFSIKQLQIFLTTSSGPELIYIEKYPIWKYWEWKSRVQSAHKMEGKLKSLYSFS